MGKRGFKFLVIFFSLSVFITDFISASYGSPFSIGALFDSIDPTSMFLGVIFLVIFAFVNYSASKVFKDRSGVPNKTLVTVVSLSVALLSSYGIYKSGFDFSGVFFDFGSGIGISADWIYSLAFFIFLGLAIYLFWRFGLNSLVMLGVLFIFLGLKLLYEGDGAVYIGVVFLIVWLFFKIMFRPVSNRLINGMARGTSWSGRKAYGHYRDNVDAHRQRQEMNKDHEKAIRDNRAYDLKRYNQIISQIKSMPKGKYIKKGTSGYNQWRRLYDEADKLRKKLR